MAKLNLICQFGYLLDALESIMSFLELIFFHKAPSGYFGVRSAQLGVTFLSRNESSILRDGV